VYVAFVSEEDIDLIGLKQWITLTRQWTRGLLESFGKYQEKGNQNGTRNIKLDILTCDNIINLHHWLRKNLAESRKTCGKIPLNLNLLIRNG
jgi:hypothetical protein